MAFRVFEIFAEEIQIMIGREPRNESDILQMVRSEDIDGITRVLSKWRNTKLFWLLGTIRRSNTTLNCKDNEGLTALHHAALVGNAAIMKLLLEHGTAVDCKDCQGQRPLHYAAWQGRPEPVSVLLQWGSSVNDPNLKGEMPLHLACQYGHSQVVTQLMCCGADPCTASTVGRTALDLACEFGRCGVVRKLLCSGRCVPLLQLWDECKQVNKEGGGGFFKCSPLHAAAKNGHASVVKLLLEAGMCINISTDDGTALHEAAKYGKLEVVRLLLEHGIDVNRTNSYDQTALDLVKHYTKSSGAREIKHVLAEALASVTVKAIRDSKATASDPQALVFAEGEVITVLEKNPDGRWKGFITEDKISSSKSPRSGYFASSAVVVLPATVGGMNRGTKPVQGKKVAPPTVPGTTVTSTVDSSNNRHSGSSFGSSTGYGSGSSSNGSSGSNAPTIITTDNRSSLGSVGTDDSFPPPPSPLRIMNDPNQNQEQSCDHSAVYMTHRLTSTTNHSPDPHNCTAFPFPNTMPNTYPHHPTHTLLRRGGPPPSPLYQIDSHRIPPTTTAEGGYMYTGTTMLPPNYHYHHHLTVEDQGIDVGQSPGRDSPGSSGSGSSSGGCRHSTTSLDSGRASGSVSEGRTNSNHGGYAQMSIHRLSGQSYESSHSSGGSLRHSYPSSSSCSSGSLERGEVDSAICNLNVNDMINAGLPDNEIINAWLTDLHFEDYYHLFVQAGYDMTTITRMTPEDLTAIGIKKPNHRKKLKAEIAQLSVSDGLPDYIPATIEEWLHIIHLDEYFNPLRSQGYQTVEQVTQLTWEDLEDIGIVRLGHQKKILLAIKRVKDIMCGKIKTSHHPQDMRFAPKYQTHEITINHSPQDPYRGTTTVPEFTTFQQGTMPNNRIARWELGDGSYYEQHPVPASSYQAYYQPDVIPVQAQQGTRGKSLESLSSERGVEPMYTFHSFYGDCPPYSAWPQQRSYDDGDITPTNECALLMHEGCMSGGTLPRPRGMVKPRPIAKIFATKPQQPMPYIEDFQKQQQPMVIESYKSLPRDPLQRERFLGPFNGGNPVLKATQTAVPPMPPKRTVSDSANVKDECTASTEDFPPPPPEMTQANIDENGGSDTSDSPSSGGSMSVCSVREKFAVSPPQTKAPTQQSNTLPRKSNSNGASRDPSPGTGSDASDSELGNNLLFRQRRNGSDASFKSTSSTESESMPFANENAGTIKQVRAGTSRTPQDGSETSIPTTSPNDRPISQQEEIARLRQLNQALTRTAARSTGRESDVLNDIGSMLADLTSELDAMLEEERHQHD